MNGPNTTRVLPSADTMRYISPTMRQRIGAETCRTMLANVGKIHAFAVSHNGDRRAHYRLFVTRGDDLVDITKYVIDALTLPATLIDMDRKTVSFRTLESMCAMPGHLCALIGKKPGSLLLNWVFIA